MPHVHYGRVQLQWQKGNTIRIEQQKKSYVWCIQFNYVFVMEMQAQQSSSVFWQAVLLPLNFYNWNLLGEKKLYILPPEMRRLNNKMKVIDHLISNYTPSVLSHPFQKLGLTRQRRQLWLLIKCKLVKWNICIRCYPSNKPILIATCTVKINTQITS